MDCPHGESEESLNQRWEVAEQQNADVAVCACCTGPTLENVAEATCLCNRCKEMKR